ncbi:MAG: hypothetical protein M1819_002941 [Sarea resinae]|nr:MAG: hypothetical protein M1819_002941 [Sarea resinae]
MDLTSSERKLQSRRPERGIFEKSADERRLCGDYEYDTFLVVCVRLSNVSDGFDRVPLDAVPISTPTSQYPDMAKPPGQAFQPRNTLSQAGRFTTGSEGFQKNQSPKRGHTTDQKPAPNPASHAILQPNKTFDLHASQDLQPRKRMKWSHSPSEDDFLELKGDPIGGFEHVVRRVQPSDTPSINSQGSAMIKPLQHGMSNPSEYHKVENTVSVPSSRRKRRRYYTIGQNGTTSRLRPNQSSSSRPHLRRPSNLIEISEDEDSQSRTMNGQDFDSDPPEVYGDHSSRKFHGTDSIEHAERQKPKSSMSSFQQPSKNSKDRFNTTGDGLPEAPRGSRSKPERKPHVEVDLTEGGEQNISNFPSPPLRHKFVRDDDETQASPDELHTGTTFGAHGREISPTLPPLLDRRKDESLRRGLLRHVTPPDHDQGLSKSDIQMTEFVSSGKIPTQRHVPAKPPSSTKAVKNPKKSSYPLKTFSRGGKTIHECTLNIQMDGTFIFDNLDDDLIAESRLLGELQVHPVQIRQLCKVLWANGGCKLRLETSKIGTIDHRIDIETRSEKVASDLIIDLESRESSCKVVMKTKDEMDRIFSKTASELASFKNQNGHTSSDALELKLFENRQIRVGAKVGEKKKSQKPSEARPAERLQPATGVSRESSQNRTRLREGLRNDRDEIAEPLHNTRQRTRSTAAITSLRQSSSPTRVVREEEKFSKRVGLGPPWHKPLVYPPEGPKKVTVEYFDLLRLDEGEFLNDNLISFYLRYLEYKIEQTCPEKAKKMYFFNTYFYASLTKTANGRRGFNYEAVQRWTSKVDIFNYEFVVVPINECSHWYLAIIANLPNVERNLHKSSPFSSPGSSQIISLDGAADVIDPEQDLVPDSVSDSDVGRKTASEVNGAEGQVSQSSLDKTRSRLSPGTELVQESRGNIEQEAAEEWPSEAEAEPPANQKGSNFHVDAIGSSPEVEIELAAQSKAHEAQAKTPSTSRKKKCIRKSPALKKYPKHEPIVMILDSLGLPHSQTVKNLKQYVSEEGKAKRQLEVSIAHGMTAKEIPLQDNFCDCGLYLLGYVVKFLEDPRQFANKILRRKMDEKRDWPEFNASRMRESIRTLLFTLHNEQKIHVSPKRKKSNRFLEGSKVPPTRKNSTTVSTMSEALPDEAATSAVDEPRGENGKEMINLAKPAVSPRGPTSPPGDSVNVVQPVERDDIESLSSDPDQDMLEQPTSASTPPKQLERSSRLSEQNLNMSRRKHRISFRDSSDPIVTSADNSD